MPSETRPLFGRGVSEMKPTTLTVGVRGVAQRVPDGLDVLAAADEHRAALVAGQRAAAAPVNFS